MHMTEPEAADLSRYDALIAQGAIRVRPTTTKHLDQIPSYPVPEDSSPLDVLLAER
jgi:hypothetical protein